jgi:hypothetical protein
LYRIPQNVHNRLMQFGQPGAGDRRDRLGWMDSRAVQSFGGVDVAEAGDSRLIHQKELGRLVGRTGDAEEPLQCEFFR